MEQTFPTYTSLLYSKTEGLGILLRSKATAQHVRDPRPDRNTTVEENEKT